MLICDSVNVLEILATLIQSFYTQRPMTTCSLVHMCPQTAGGSGFALWTRVVLYLYYIRTVWQVHICFRSDSRSLLKGRGGVEYNTYFICEE